MVDLPTENWCSKNLGFRLMGVRPRLERLHLVIFLVVATAVSAAPGRAGSDAPTWQDDWSVERGISLSIDTQGYQHPSAIAFVPHPGPSPEDPLYFVTELHGRVLVVTNDRAMHTFAEGFFELEPVVRRGRPSLELGMAGLCLDPQQGYVFVTFIHHDDEGVLRNNVVRFSTRPGVFSTRPSSRIDFGPVFGNERSAVSHQVGPCQVKDGLLYVSVGDGEQPVQSQALGSTLGKILRLTVDGEPVPANPYFENDGTKSAIDYVYAYGFRNPFGLAMVGDALFAADNGPAVDRFVRVEAGENYLWGKSELSVGTKAIVVLAPGHGVAQTTFNPPGSTALGPGWQSTFFQVRSGDTERLHRDDPPQILAFEYDLARMRLAGAPAPFVRYRGQAQQTIAGAAIGPDGLYFAAIFPNSSGVTAVYRASYDPPRSHPRLIVDDDGDPLLVMRDSGCFGCHELNGRGGDVGPSLDPQLLVPRLEARLESPEYRRLSDSLDASDDDFFVSTRAARREVVEATNRHKIKVWIKHHVLAPRFDNPGAAMPEIVGMTEERADLIAAALAGADAGLLSRLRADLMRAFRRRAVVLSAGMAIGAAAVLVASRMANRRRG